MSWSRVVLGLSGVTDHLASPRAILRRVDGAPLSRTSRQWLPVSVAAGRAVHGLITVVFLSCIAQIYVEAARRRVDRRTLTAVGALAGEGAVVALSGGNCPLGPLFRRWGDDKPFFELLLPPRAARAAVPVFTLISVAGVIALMVRSERPGREN